MYQFRRPNRLYRYIINCSKRKRYAITIAFLITLILCWHIILYRRQVKNTAYYENEILHLHEQKKQNIAIQDRYAQMQSEFSVLQKKYNKKFIGSSADQVHQALTWLIECANKFNIILRSCTPLKKSTQSGYSSAPFEILLEGKFYNYLDFFNCVGQSPYLIKIETCKISRKKEGTISCKFILKLLIVRA